MKHATACLLCLVKSNYLFASTFSFYLLYMYSKYMHKRWQCNSTFKNTTIRLVYKLLIICFYTYNLVVIRTHRVVNWVQHIIYRCRFYSISREIFVTDTIRVRLIPYSILIIRIRNRDNPYSYMYPVAIRVRIQILTEIWKQIWYQRYPFVSDPFSSLQEATKRASSTIILNVQVSSAQLKESKGWVKGSNGLQLRPCNLAEYQWNWL
jgi:hypothetical protein